MVTNSPRQRERPDDRPLKTRIMALRCNLVFELAEKAQVTGAF